MQKISYRKYVFKMYRLPLKTFQTKKAVFLNKKDFIFYKNKEDF